MNSAYVRLHLLFTQFSWCPTPDLIAKCCYYAITLTPRIKVTKIGGAGKSYISTPCKILYFTQQSKSYTFCTPCQNLYCTPWKILYGLHSSQNLIHKICTAVLTYTFFTAVKILYLLMILLYNQVL